MCREEMVVIAFGLSPGQQGKESRGGFWEEDKVAESKVGSLEVLKDGTTTSAGKMNWKERRKYIVLGAGNKV